MPIFDEIVQQLQAREPLAPLYPTQLWSESLSHQIVQASDEELFGPLTAGPDETMSTACRAGLLLWNDDLDASHRISQGIENPTGSFWHAIMHRREGDAANSQYWWRKTGSHPAFADVYTEAMSTLDNESNEPAQELAASLRRAGTWAPIEFVAHCEMARLAGEEADWLKRVQGVEMAVLLNWCRARLENQ